MTSIANATPALESTITALRANLRNLSPRSKYLAEGILSTVDRTKRVTPKQATHLDRLERLSRTKFRGRTYKVSAEPIPPQPPAVHPKTLASEGEPQNVALMKVWEWNGKTHKWAYSDRYGDEFASISLVDGRYVVSWALGGPLDALDTFDQALTLIDGRAPRGVDPVRLYHKRGFASVPIVNPNATVPKSAREIKRDRLRADVLAYRRDDSLPRALPLHLQPETMAPEILRGCLIRRLRMLRAEGIPMGLRDRQTANARIHVVRVCLIAEGLTLLRERFEARSLDQDVYGDHEFDEIPPKQVGQEARA